MIDGMGEPVGAATVIELLANGAHRSSSDRPAPTEGATP